MSIVPFPRFDLYAPIHKTLRAFMADTLTTVGRMDAHDVADLQEALAQLDSLLQVLEMHIHSENGFVHAAMESRRAGSSLRIAGEHHDHELAIASLRDASANLLASGPTQRDALALSLYRELALFVAENFEHMQIEETDHNLTLRAAFSDAELMGIEQAIVASHTPEQMGGLLRWMLPYISHGERCAMLMGMRQNAPAEVFNGVLALARAHLRQRDWIKLLGVLTIEASEIPGAALERVA